MQVDTAFIESERDMQLQVNVCNHSIRQKERRWTKYKIETLHP
jgi:hypothetical protein